jgi:hypothetical protein
MLPAQSRTRFARLDEHRARVVWGRANKRGRKRVSRKRKTSRKSQKLNRLQMQGHSITLTHTLSRGMLTASQRLLGVVSFESAIRTLLSQSCYAYRAQCSTHSSVATTHASLMNMNGLALRHCTHRRTGGRSALRSPCALCTTHSLLLLNFDCMVCCEYCCVGLLLRFIGLLEHGLHSDAASLSAKLVLSCLLCRTLFLSRLSHPCSTFFSLLQMIA